MATRKRKVSENTSRSPERVGPDGSVLESIGTILSTVSAPSTAAIDASAVATLDTESQQRLATQKIGAQAMSSALMSNPLKPHEFGLQAGSEPRAGEPVEPPNPIDTASTVTEDTPSEKLGDGVVQAGYNPGNESL
ncbi:MAG: hypothetical protein ABIS28_04285, partial [Caldimonas sp.]